MKIAMCGAFPTSDEGPRGGVEAAAMLLATGLARSPGIRVEAVTIRGDGGRDEVRQMGPVVLHLLAAAKPLPYVLRMTGPDARRVRERLRRIDPDIVHAQAIDTGAFAAVNSGYGSIVTIHGIARRDVLAEMRSPWDVIRLIQVCRVERVVARRATALIAVSPAAMSAYSRLRPEGIALIPNAVDSVFATTVRTPEQGRILAAGAIRPLKGFHVLIEAMPLVLKQRPDTILVIAGTTTDARYHAKLCATIARLGLQERVTFLGDLSTAALAREYARAELFCLPSLQESAPLVVAQAMMMGIPCVASRVGGVPWMLDDGRAGELVASGEREELAVALCGVMTDSNRAQALAANGRKLALSRFDSDAVTAQTIARYEALLAEQR